MRLSLTDWTGVDAAALSSAAGGLSGLRLGVEINLGQTPRGDAIASALNLNAYFVDGAVDYPLLLADIEALRACMSGGVLTLAGLSALIMSHGLAYASKEGRELADAIVQTVAFAAGEKTEAAKIGLADAASPVGEARAARQSISETDAPPLNIDLGYVSPEAMAWLSAESLSADPVPSLRLTHDEDADRFARCVDAALTQAADEPQRQDVTLRVLGAKTLDQIDGLERNRLEARGLTSEALDRIEQSLKDGLTLKSAFSRWVVGDDVIRRRLGLPPEAFETDGEALLRALGISARDIEDARAAIQGRRRPVSDPTS
ncbi:MAG: TSCPD domain-containing protein, partial [Pseudomonadota bacterium]